MTVTRGVRGRGESDCVTRGPFACLFLTARSADDIGRVLDAISPPLIEPAKERHLQERLGVFRAVVLVPQKTAHPRGVPAMARRCAELAYDQGAIRVEYYNEEMDRFGSAPFFIRPARCGANPLPSAPTSLGQQTDLFGGAVDHFAD